MSVNILIPSLSQITEAAQSFVEIMGSRKVFAFYGEMGAGKTTFVRAICKALGVCEVVNSPRFSIVNEYESETTGQVIFHFDFYRINRIEEVYDMGYEEYFYSGNVCFIEWPELIEELLPDDVVRVCISVDANEARKVEINN